MLQRVSRATASLFCAFAAAFLTTSDPSHAATVQADVVGHAVWGNFVGNHTIGGPGRYKVALRGQAPFAACFNKFSTYLIASPNNTGYSKGNGGSIKISVQRLDSADLPSGQVLGAAAAYNPGLASGGLASGQTVAGTLFREVTFPTAACLTAGQKFAIVFENVAPDPVNNYLGVNTLGVARASNSPALSPIWRTLMLQNGRWVIRLPNEYHTPIMRLCRSSDNACIVQTYMETAGPQRIGAKVQARQILNPAKTRTVRTCRLTLTRATSTATTVRVGLTTLASPSTYLAGNTAFANVSISALPVVGSGFAASEVSLTLPAPVTLTGGVLYTLLITTPTSGGIYLAPVKDGTPYFATSSGFGAKVGRAQFNAGSGWKDWDVGARSDFQAYCQ